MEDLIKISIDTDSLLDAFNIVPNQGKPCLELDKWLAATGILTPLQSALLDDVYERYHDFINGWNEEELKMKMISFLFHIADIEERGKIATFFERPLKATINNYKLSVICDCLVATPKGLSTPKFPYFFLQEFKKGKGDSHDPEAQMLAAMLIAQQVNNDGKTIYGSWLVGSNWKFTTLTGKNYCSSKWFDATNKDELTSIVFILRQLKNIILNIQ
jgi:hypothetical protein